jgi:uncharacterized delta-60 repeat protein
MMGTSRRPTGATDWLDREPAAHYRSRTVRTRRPHDMALRRALVSALLAALALTALPAAPAHAAPGDLDTTFGGGDGFVTYDSGDTDAGQKILRQPDGKIVVVGDAVSQAKDTDVFLARYRKNGTPDPNFGGGSGIVSLDFMGGYDDMWALNRTTDGRLVVAGFAENPAGTVDRVAAARFMPNGNPDNSFSGDGKTSILFPGYPFAFGWRSVLLPNGKLVVVGEASTSGGQTDLFVVRFRPNGTLDSSFSGDGRFAIDLGGDDGAWDVRRLPDGTLLAAGWSNRATEGRTAMVWLSPNGTLNHAYGGGDGKATIDLVPNNQQEYARAIFPLASGKVVVVGNADKAAAGGSDQDLYVARVKPNGTRDTTFGGGDGVVGTEGGGSEAMFGARRTSGGTIVAAGFRDLGFFVARLRPNGTADPSFGTGGFANPFGSNSRANDVVILGNGKVVVAAQVNDDVMTARLQG